MTLLDSAVWGGKLYSDGWQDSASVHPVVEPATGAQLGTVGLATEKDAHRAAARAAEAQRAWAATSPQARAAVLRRAGELFTEHAAEIEDWLVREAGSVRAKAGSEAQLAVGECFECASLPTHPQGEVLTTEEARWSLTRRRPAGVVSVIAPFNFPLILGLRSVAPALALGNAVLLKPDPRTAVTGGVVIARIFEEAGLLYRCAAPAAGRRRGRTGGRRGPGGPGDLLHRFDTGRAAIGERACSPPEAGPPGARRKQRSGRAARCRCAEGGIGRRVRFVSAPGPDLHDDRPPHRPRVAGGGVHGRARGEGPCAAGRRPRP